MIEKLTPEQEALFPVYIEKGIKVGTDTSCFTQEEAEKIVNDIYTVILEKPIPEDGVKVFDSPKAVWAYVCEVVGKKMDFVWPYFSGSFDSFIFANYDFFIDELKAEVDEKILHKYNVWKKQLQLGPIFPFDDICLVSQKPVEIHFKDKKLHNETGPAIKYNDGFCVYALNGVRVTKELVETPWDALDPNIMLKERNAEVRREIVRKIGIERVIEKLGAEVIDKDKKQVAGVEHEYELLLFDIGNDNKCPYLKMINPSIGTYHIEGVHPDCKTVSDALAWRNGTKDMPSQLT